MAANINIIPSIIHVYTPTGIASWTFTIEEFVVGATYLINATNGAITINLPVTNFAQGPITFQRSTADKSANVITLICPTGFTFPNGATSMSLGNGSNGVTFNVFNSVYQTSVSGRLLSRIAFSTPGVGTYQPPVGTNTILIQMIGGGGGGGAAFSGSGQRYNTAGGGASGAWSEILLTGVGLPSTSAYYTYQVGAGGTQSLLGNVPGWNGGITTFGLSTTFNIAGLTTFNYTAPGGSGGASQSNVGGFTCSAGGLGGVPGTGPPGSILVGGNPGMQGVAFSSLANGMYGGNGAPGFFGGGGLSSSVSCIGTNFTAINGNSYGSGGGGGVSSSSIGTSYGGVGGTGLIILWLIS